MVGAWGKKGVKYSMPFITKSKKMAYLIAAALIVIIIFSFTLTGCGVKKVATVNGEVIKAADFDHRLAEYPKLLRDPDGHQIRRGKRARNC